MHANFVHTLIAAVPDQRLRELVVGIVLAAVRCLTAETAETSPTAPTHGRRHRSRDKARAHWSRARRDAELAKRRERRALARAGNGRKRRGRKPVAAAGNGTEATANGRRVPVTAAALWAHAAKLEPKAPWRAVVRELAVSESAAQAAERDGILPCTPKQTRRFLQL
jgi:hypothetical protein